MCRRLRSDDPDEHWHGSRPAYATHCRTSASAGSNASSPSSCKALVSPTPGNESSSWKRRCSCPSPAMIWRAARVSRACERSIHCRLRRSSSTTIFKLVAVTDSACSRFFSRVAVSVSACSRRTTTVSDSAAAVGRCQRRNGMRAAYSASTRASTGSLLLRSSSALPESASRRRHSCLYILFLA